jgi:hypothetical protein
MGERSKVGLPWDWKSAARVQGGPDVKRSRSDTPRVMVTRCNGGEGLLESPNRPILH